MGPTTRSGLAERTGLGPYAICAPPVSLNSDPGPSAGELPAARRRGARSGFLLPRRDGRFDLLPVEEHVELRVDAHTARHGERLPERAERPRLGVREPRAVEPRHTPL